MPNPNISQIATTTLDNYRKEITDNVIGNHPLLVKMKENGNIIKESGGKSFQEKISYAENGTVQWQGEYDTYNTTPQDVLSSAEFSQKILTGTMTMSDLENLQNAGPERIASLMEAKKKVLESSLKNEMGSAIYADGTGSSSQEIGGLQLLIADDPTTGTVGNINRANYSFWRNQLYSFAAESVTPSSSEIQSAMNTLYRRCQSQVGELPDLLSADDTYFGYYEDSLQTNQRFSSEKTAALGFDNLKYKSSTIIYDPQCPAAHIYFINTKHVFLKHLGDFFAVSGSNRPVNQGVDVKALTFTGNMTIDNSKVHGVMTA